jgi:hypothetical protein
MTIDVWLAAITALGLFIYLVAVLIRQGLPAIGEHLAFNDYVSKPFDSDEVLARLRAAPRTN